MGACNQGKEDLKQLAYSRMHSASSATGENVLQWEQLPLSFAQVHCRRSEERRVGKEC